MLAFDLSRAFDAIWHNGFIQKLMFYGCSSYLVRLLRSYLTYLTNRSFRVRVGNYFSDSFPVLAGVPQGSVLAPTLLNVSVVDILSQLGEN